MQPRAVLKHAFPHYRTKRFEDTYTLHEHLSHGSYGVVTKCVSKKTRKEYADKHIDKERLKHTGDVKSILTEAKILHDLEDAHICQLHDFYETDDAFHLVLEYCEGGDLQVYLAKNTICEGDCKHILQNLFKALQHMHRRGIAHRDVKLENLMLGKSDDLADIRLCDFGFASEVGEIGLSDCLGTPNYMAPEVIGQAGYSTAERYDTKCDIWSAGVLAFVLLSGTHPFPETANGNRARVWGRISKGIIKWDQAAWQAVSPEAQEFVKSLLVIDPDKRPSATQVLKHRWLSDDGSGLKTPITFSPVSTFRAGIFAVEAINHLTRLSSPTSSSASSAGLGYDLHACPSALSSSCPSSSDSTDFLTSNTSNDTLTMDCSNQRLGVQQFETTLVELKNCDTVKRLVLTRCGLTDQCVSKLVQTLKNNTTIESMALDDNVHIGDKGGMALMSLCERNRNIQTISVNGTSISECVERRLHDITDSR